jgi:hypothetical protein
MVATSPIALRSASRLPRNNQFTCLRQLIIKFAIPNGIDQRVDDRWQLFQRRDSDGALAFFEFNRFVTCTYEENKAVRSSTPPRPNALVFFAGAFLTVLLQPSPDGARVI